MDENDQKRLAILAAYAKKLEDGFDFPEDLEKDPGFPKKKEAALGFLKDLAQGGASSAASERAQRTVGASSDGDFVNMIWPLLNCLIPEGVRDPGNKRTPQNSAIAISVIILAHLATEPSPPSRAEASKVARSIINTSTFFGIKPPTPERALRPRKRQSVETLDS